MSLQKRTWKELNEYKKGLILTTVQQDVIVGTALGDLGIQQIGKFSRLVFEQKNKDYLYNIYEVFKDFTRTPPKERTQQRLPTSEVKSTFYFSTISHEYIQQYRSLFYPEGKKVIPLNIEDYLTPRALAYWFMDDGSFVSAAAKKIATCGFSFEENNLLVSALKNKYNIDAEIKIQDKR